MDGSVALLFASALVLISTSSASTDKPVIEQLTRDFSQQILEVQESTSQADPAVSQGDVAPELSTTLTQEESGPTSKSHSDGILPDYPVQFPPARPSAANLQAICLHGDRRPRYSDSYFPASGFGSLRHRAEAVNNAESWFGTCCERNDTWTQEWILCCATQAWELALNSFCEEEGSVKNRVHECCELLGNEILDCFQKDAPNPNYEPTEEEPVPPLPFEAPFNFDNTTCQGPSQQYRY